MINIHIYHVWSFTRVPFLSVKSLLCLSCIFTSLKVKKKGITYGKFYFNITEDTREDFSFLGQCSSISFSLDIYIIVFKTTEVQKQKNN